MKFNKLVRDKIPELIKSKGLIPVVHIAKNKEYWLRLKEKLAEEVKEFIADENIKELADILEVLDAIVDYKKFKKNSILSVKNGKAKARGKFKKRIILDETRK